MQLQKVQDTLLSFKVILLGDANVGKTSFIKQYIDHQFYQKTQSTCNVDFFVKHCQIDEFSVKLHIFDTAGQQRFRSLTRSYFKGTDAILFMYDMSNKDSFVNLSGWVDFYEREAEKHEEIRVLVGAKKDKLSANNTQVQTDKQPIERQVIEKEEIKSFIEKSKFVFKFETSAKENANIDAVFEQLTRNLIYNSLQRKKFATPIREEEWSIILKRDKQHLMKQQQKNKGCC